MLNKLEVKHLTKIFGKGKSRHGNGAASQESKTEILRKNRSLLSGLRVSFEVRPGYVIMELSGSGKSTLRLLSRLIDIRRHLHRRSGCG